MSSGLSYCAVTNARDVRNDSELFSSIVVKALDVDEGTDWDHRDFTYSYCTDGYVYSVAFVHSFHRDWSTESIRN